MRLLDSFLLGQWRSPTGDDEDAEMVKGTLDGDREDGLANELVALCTISELMLQSQDSEIGEYLVAPLPWDDYSLLPSGQMHRDCVPSTS